MRQSQYETLDSLFSPASLCLASDDFERVTDTVSRIFSPHALHLHDGAGHLRAEMHHRPQAGFSLNRLTYGADVTVDADRLTGFYLVQIPIDGHADIHCGNSQMEASPQRAFIASPTVPLRMRWFSGTHLCVRFEQETVTHRCESHLGHTLDRPVEFEPAFSLRAATSRRFLQILERPGDGSEPVASALLDALLYGQPHTWSAALRRTQPRLAPHFVRRAEDYIRHHYRDPLTIETLADVTTVSIRTLFAGFRDFRDTTPMAYLRDVRLERARAALLSGKAATAAQVTTVALDCGFTHLGRFAASYRERFGETPSATARVMAARH